MKKIYARSEEKWMKAYVLYADSSNYLCVDAAKQKKASKEEVINAFRKGMVIETATATYKPTALTVADGYSAVSLIVMGTSVAEVATFYSDGYTAG